VTLGFMNTADQGMATNAWSKLGKVHRNVSRHTVYRILVYVNTQ